MQTGHILKESDVYLSMECDWSFLDAFCCLSDLNFFQPEKRLVSIIPSPLEVFDEVGSNKYETCTNLLQDEASRSLNNGSALELTSIRLINIRHTILETRGVLYDEAQVDWSVMPQMFI
jgi:hypothetical protein